LAWLRQIELAVAKKVKGVVITSSPSFADSEGFDGYHQSICTGSATDGMLDAKVFLHLLFELFNLFSHYVVMSGEYLFQICPDILHQGLVLSV
jgi:hypothetical protein